MHKDTLKAIIIDCKENQNMSFARIAEVLDRDYGIKRDRQAIQGMYNRAIARKTKENMKYARPELVDVVNLHVLGYTMAEIQSTVKSWGTEVSYYKIRSVLAKEVEYIEKIRKEYILKAVTALKDDSILKGCIKARLLYRGIEITDKGLHNILVDAYIMIITNQAINELAKAYSILDDREIIKEIIIKAGLNVTMSDIKSRI